MNSFCFSKKIDGTGPNKVKFILSPEITENFISLFRQYFEIPFLQGSQKTNKKGQVVVRFELDDENASLLKKAFLQAYIINSGHQTLN